METAIVSDSYYKWTNTNALSWMLHKNVIYYKHVKFLMLLFKSSIFIFFFIIIALSIKPGRYPPSDPPPPRPALIWVVTWRWETTAVVYLLWPNAVCIWGWVKTTVIKTGLQFELWTPDLHHTILERQAVEWAAQITENSPHNIESIHIITYFSPEAN
jgi:hypothetical protein